MVLLQASEQMGEELRAVRVGAVFEPDFFTCSSPWSAYRWQALRQSKGLQAVIELLCDWWCES